MCVCLVHEIAVAHAGGAPVLEMLVLDGVKKQREELTTSDITLQTYRG